MVIYEKQDTSREKEIKRETHDSCLSPSTEPGLAAPSRQKLDAARLCSRGAQSSAEHGADKQSRPTEWILNDGRRTACLCDL